MLSAWWGFCRLAVQAGYLQADPAVGLETPAGPGRLPVGFSEDELAPMLAAAGRPDYKLWGLLAGPRYCVGGRPSWSEPAQERDH